MAYLIPDIQVVVLHGDPLVLNGHVADRAPVFRSAEVDLKPENWKPGRGVLHYLWVFVRTPLYLAFKAGSSKQGSALLA